MGWKWPANLVCISTNRALVATCVHRNRRFDIDALVAECGCRKASFAMRINRISVRLNADRPDFSLSRGGPMGVSAEVNLRSVNGRSI
jgi:hypothetical protein